MNIYTFWLEVNIVRKFVWCHLLKEPTLQSKLITWKRGSIENIREWIMCFFASVRGCDISRNLKTASAAKSAQWIKNKKAHA